VVRFQQKQKKGGGEYVSDTCDLACGTKTIQEFYLQGGRKNVELKFRLMSSDKLSWRCYWFQKLTGKNKTLTAIIETSETANREI
jgi:hypothetical protein